jgi:hypothetical protein
MDQGQKRATLGRYQRWQNLNPSQQQQLRRRFNEFQTLSPDQQRRVRQRFSQFQNMTPENKERLRQRFRSLTPEQRTRALEQMKRRAREQGGRHNNSRAQSPQRPQR